MTLEDIMAFRRKCIEGYEPTIDELKAILAACREARIVGVTKPKKKESIAGASGPKAKAPTLADLFATFSGGGPDAPA